MDDVFFGLGFKYDSGRTPSVALNKHGKVLALHERKNVLEKPILYFMTGDLLQSTIDWDQNQSSGRYEGQAYGEGVTPAVALNDDNVAVAVHGRDSKLYSHFFSYHRATTPGWREEQEYGYGITPSVAVNKSGVVVEVHQSQKNDGLWYHRGELDGESVLWEESVRYDQGSSPKVAINNHGRMVEVHEEQGRLVLRFGNVRDMFTGGRRAEISGGSCANPSVALTDDDFLIVTYEEKTNLRKRWLHQYVGDYRRGLYMDHMSAHGYDVGYHTSVAAAGNMSVECHDDGASLYFSTSIITDRANWMSDRCNPALAANSTLRNLSDSTLHDLTLPGSHDAGMYVGSIENAGKTQSLTIHEQLLYGIRYFDLRPGWDGKKFVIYHNFIGGPPLTDVLDDIRRFAREHRELVVLKFSHLSKIGPENYRMLVNEISDYLGKWLVKETEYVSGWDRRRFLNEVPLRDYIKEKSALLVLVDSKFAADPKTKREGFWVYRDMKLDPNRKMEEDPWAEIAECDLCVYDSYSNTTDLESMTADQMKKWSEFEKTKPSRGSLSYEFLLSWTLTPWLNVEATSGAANRCLGDQVTGTSYRAVNILYVDYVQYARVTDVALFKNLEKWPGYGSSA